MIKTPLTISTLLLYLYMIWATAGNSLAENPEARRGDFTIAVLNSSKDLPLYSASHPEK